MAVLTVIPGSNVTYLMFSNIPLPGTVVQDLIVVMNMQSVPDETDTISMPVVISEPDHAHGQQHRVLITTRISDFYTRIQSVECNSTM